MKCRFLEIKRILAALFLLASIPLQTVKADAHQSKDIGTQSKTPARGSVAAGIEILTDTEGVDFNSYLREVYLSVKKEWFANMPPSVEMGNQGVNTVEFRIQQNGNVPRDFLKMAYRSGKSDLDAASLQAVRGAGPFNPLPEKFSQPFILLRLTFYYNIQPPKR